MAKKKKLKQPCLMDGSESAKLDVDPVISEKPQSDISSSSIVTTNTKLVKTGKNSKPGSENGASTSQQNGLSEDGSAKNARKQQLETPSTSSSVRNPVTGQIKQTVPSISATEPIVIEEDCTKTHVPKRTVQGDKTDKIKSSGGKKKHVIIKEDFTSVHTGRKKTGDGDQKKASKKPVIFGDISEIHVQEQKTAPSSKKVKQKKEKVISRMEQKMNMRKKKIKDPRLIPRMREYLESRANKNFVSIPLMVEYLRQKYPEYGRKKKGMFFQYVDKAYSYMEKPGNNDPPPPLSDTDENSNTEKELVEENGHYVWKNVSEHSRESDMDEEGEAGAFDTLMENNSNVSSDEEEDVEQLVEYKDSNAINNRLMSMYRNSPTHVSKSTADDKKRKAPETPDKTTKKCKSETTGLYPSPNVLESVIPGLVDPRRPPNDNYFIDRKGSNAASKKDKPDSKESREVTIQKFLGNLPSRASFSAYVPVGNDPRLKGGALYRMFSGKSVDDEQHANLFHSGITQDNTGVTNQSPTSPPLQESEDMESSMVDNPKRKGAGDVMENDLNAGKEKLSRGDVSVKNKAVRTPKKKKGGAKAKRQDDSDSESNKLEKGIAVQKSTVTFADVGGNDASLTEICKLLVHMRHPEVYQQLGVTPPRGFLLHGPPGCGKTLLANAIAGELDLPMIKLAATEIVSGVSGESEEKIRDLFDKAAQCAPCVMFIDEIDSITPKRETASKDMERRIVAQLLACMDDLNANPSCHVLVIGATNRPDSLDPALRRAGRFDREICLGIPDEQSRLRILRVLCRNLRLSSDFDFSYMAHNTPGYVGADLMALAREAAMTAVNRVFQDLQSGSSNTTVDHELVCGTSAQNTLSNNSITDLEVNGRNSNNQNITDSSSIVAEIGTSSDVAQVVTNSSLDQSCMNVSQLGTSLNVGHPDSTASVRPGSSSVTNLNKDKPGPSLNVAESGSSSRSSDNLLHWADKSINTSIKLLETTETLLHNVNGYDGKDDVTTEESNNAKGKTSAVNGESETGNANDDTNNVNNETSNANAERDFVARTCEDKVCVSDAAEQDIAAQSAVVRASEFAMNATEIGATLMELDGEHIGIGKDNSDIGIGKENSKDNQGISHQQTTTSVRKIEYISVLSWLKDHPPLTESQLADLYITMDDFKEALKFVQPSAQREGFATIPDVTWDDIGALHEVREELQLAILAPVRHPEQFKSLGLTRAQGVLLAGPPGCGKTLLAKAVANESGINFISVKGPELLNMYVGESERAVRTVFQRARNSAPCVIFFDELDALCPRRSGHSEGNSSARVVNQLLTEMDGLEERKQVFIMAATNRPDIIDPAVLRPGRLDKTLYVGLPTMSDRLDILACITKNGTMPKLGDDVNLARVAEDSRCNCFTGADLAALVREASIMALKEAISCTGRQPSDIIIVNGDHFDTAFKKIRPSVTPKDQERYDSIRSKLVIG